MDENTKFVIKKIQKLNAEFFIAKKLTFSKESKKNVTGPIIKIAIAGISIGLIVMIIAVSIVTGFKQEIRQKIIGFGSHLQILHYETNHNYESKPISKKQDFLQNLGKIQEVKSAQVFAIKAGIVKLKNEAEGVILKGISTDFNWDFFRKYLISGSAFNISDTAKTDNILISKHLSDKMRLKVNDALPMYFVNESSEPRMRKFKISGIYNTGLEEFDKLYVIGDIAHVQKLNNWDSSRVSGFEIICKNFDQIKIAEQKINELLTYNISKEENLLKVVSIHEKFPQLFDWLELQDLNVWIILGLMVIVAGFNMVSGLLIMILEKTNLIGVLKSLGAQNLSIRKIFLFQSSFLIMRGLAWGNIIGIGLCLIQYFFGVAKLDSAAYYVSEVPISINLVHILLLNLGTLIITVSMLVLPSFIISKISPTKAIQFN